MYSKYLKRYENLLNLSLVAPVVFSDILSSSNVRGF